MAATHPNAFNISTIQSQISVLPLLPDKFRPRIAIVGCGGIVSEAHLPVYSQYQIPVAGVFDTSERASQLTARSFGVAKVYRSIDELLSDPTVDVVDIATHPDVRVDLICQALDAGKHVLAQKPLATDLASARRVIDRAAKSQYKVAVNQNARWAPPWYVATQLITQGVIGKVLSVTLMQNSNFSYITDTRFDNDPHFSIFDFSIHWIDIIRCWLAESTIKDIRAVQYRLPNQPTESKTPWGHWICISYDDGVNAAIRGVGSAQPPEVQGHPFWIHGERGTLHGSVRHREFIEMELDGAVHRFDLKGNWYLDGFAGAMGELLWAILENREPYNSPQHNLLTLQMTLAACESASRGGAPIVLAGQASEELCRD